MAAAGLGAYQCLLPTDEDETIVRLLASPRGNRPIAFSRWNGTDLILNGVSPIDGSLRARRPAEADGAVLKFNRTLLPARIAFARVTDAPLRFSSLAARMCNRLSEFDNRQCVICFEIFRSVIQE